MRRWSGPAQEDAGGWERRPAAKPTALHGDAWTTTLALGD